MLNWRARKPSTASVTPAITKTMKAHTVLLVEISQMVSGTRKSRLIEMRLGIVIGCPISASAAASRGYTHGIAGRHCQEGPRRAKGAKPLTPVLARLRIRRAGSRRRQDQAVKAVCRQPSRRIATLIGSAWEDVFD